VPAVAYSVSNHGETGGRYPNAVLGEGVGKASKETGTGDGHF
jgi:hypothetical protein